MSKIKFHHLKPTPGSTKSKIRKGRGEAGKRGKTAGRGTKGTGARKTVPAYFEGGQIPLYRRIPKLKGLKNTPIFLCGRKCRVYEAIPRRRTRTRI